VTLTLLLSFALLGAVLGTDVVSFPQAMVSRPIVAATLAGWIGGSVTDGLLAGVVLEMMAMETLPVGASRYPEWGTASVVGGALYVTRAGDASAALLFAVFGAMVTAWIGGWTMYALRRLNGRWTERALPALETGDPRAVTGLQMRGLVADLLRSGVLTALALALFVPVAALAVARVGPNAIVTRAVLVAAAVAVAASAGWKLSHGARRGPLFFLGGLAIGCAMLLAA
jgi:mannose/fructose/N-acetylgalactosamine-specific phosphotransferase system component IIC